MTEKISIRNAKFAKIGLQDMCDYIGLPIKSKMLEIGCYVGDSTEIFAKNYDNIVCIDPWKNGYDENDDSSHRIDMKIIEAQFDELCKQYDNIHKNKMTSEEFFILHDNYCQGRMDIFDMIYIDGLHTYDGVKADMEMYINLVKPGGWLCGHDYGSRNHPGVKIAVDEMLGCLPDKTFRDTSWCKRIKE